MAQSLWASPPPALSGSGSLAVTADVATSLTTGSPVMS
jgi:hypothetical protein